MAQPRGPDGKFACVPAYPRLRRSPCGCGGGGSHPCPVGVRLRPVREAAKREYRPRRWTPAEVEEVERDLYGVEVEREALVDALEHVRTQIQQTGSTHHRLGARSFETQDARFVGRHGGRSFSAGPDNSEMAYKRLLEERTQLRAHDAHLLSERARLRRELAVATRSLGRRTARAGAARWRSGHRAGGVGIRPGARVTIGEGAHRVVGVVEAVYEGMAHVRYSPSIGRTAHAVVPLHEVRLDGRARQRPGPVHQHSHRR